MAAEWQLRVFFFKLLCIGKRGASWIQAAESAENPVAWRPSFTCNLRTDLFVTSIGFHVFS